MSYSSRLELEIDSRSGERNLKRFEGQLNRTEQAGTGLVGAMGGIKRVVSLASAAVGGFTIGRVITETAAFEDSMLGLQAVSQATAGQMAELEKQARTLGATSMFSAQQAGDAQRFLAQAGFEVNEVLSATPGILQLATAAQMGLAEAADAASNILGGMRLEVDQLSRVNDVLAATAAGSNTSVSQLAQALSTVAPLAAAAGISIEETAAAIGVMSDAGIQAERAGTGLQGVIRQLSNVTPQAATALAGYGLSLQDVNVETHGLSAVLASLQQANISTADAFKIFGSEAGAAAQILVNGNGRVSEFTESLGDAEGEAERMANVIGSGLTGSMRGFNSMLSESLISLGRDQGVAGGFQAVLDSATGVLAVYNDMLPEFADANDLTSDQARNLELVAGALKATAGAGAGIASVYLGVRGAIVAATAAQWAFNVAVRANPLILAASAVAGLAGALYSMRDELGLTRDEAYKATIDVDDLTLAFRDLTLAQQENRKASIVGDLAEMRIEAGKLGTELVEVQRLVRSSGQLTPEGGAMPIASAEDIARGRELRQELGGMLANIDAGSDLLNEYDEIMQGLGESTSETTTRTRSSSEAITELSKAAKEAEREAERFKSTLGSLVDTLFPVEAAQRTYREEQEALTRGWNEGTLSADRYTEAMQRLENAQLSTQTASGAYGGGGGFGSEIGSRGGVGAPTDPMAGVVGNQEQDYWGKWLESAETAFTDFDQMAANTAESFQQGFGNAFESMIFDSESLRESAQGMFEGIARTMVNALGQMAGQWLAYQAVQMTIGKTTEAAAIGSAVATGSSIAAAYAPAAAMASLASFGANSAPAMAGIAATTGMAKTMSLMGMAHDGIDSVPREGTWLLDKGERVMNRPQADRLDQYLDMQERRTAQNQGNGSSAAPTINIIENPNKGGSTSQRQEQDGRWVIDVVVASITGDGQVDKAMRGKYGVQPRGR